MGALLRATVLLATVAAAPAAWGGDGSLQRARAVQDSIITLDTHVDIEPEFATPAMDPGVRGINQFDLPKMVEGGMSAIFFSVYVPQARRTPESYAEARRQALAKFDAIHRMTDEQYGDRITLALSAADVRRIHRSGRRAALIGIENGFAIGRDLGLVAQYYQRGARYLSLTHNGHNDLADSAVFQPDLGDAAVEHGGLSELGRAAIAEMNRLGIMVDVSHASKDATLQAAAASRAPVIASHSALRAFVDIPRNIGDEELRAIAARGGVVQIVALDAFLKPVPAEKTAALDRLNQEFGVSGLFAARHVAPERRPAYLERRAALDRTWPGASLRDFVSEIDYAVRLVGIDHVGIASDFDGGGGIEGWGDVSETPNVTAELLRHGYSRTQIGKLWGGNLLRVMAAVERTARQIDRGPGSQ